MRDIYYGGAGFTPKYLRAALLVFPLVGCSALSYQVLTLDEYEHITMGVTPTEIRQKYGEPNHVRHERDGKYVYEYAERLSLGGASPPQNIVEVRRYHFTFRNDRLIDKNIEVITRKSYRPMNDLLAPPF